MNKSLLGFSTLLFFVFTSAVSCSPEHQGSGSFSSESLYIPNPDPNPALRASAKAAFETHCVSCHGTGGSNTQLFNSPGGSIDMDALAQNTRYISIGQPDASFLIKAIYTIPMPAITPANNFFTDAGDQAAVEDWVADLGIISGAEDDRVFFSEVETKILAPKCYSCHESNIPSFSDYDSVLNTIVIPGNPDSALLRVTKSGEMPKNQPDLEPDEIALMEKWILGGALQ